MKNNKLFQNYIYNAAYQVLQMIMPLVTSPYISRVLGAENIGIYSYTYSIVFYFGIFANLGINHYGNRAIAKSRTDRNELNYTFSAIFLLHVILSLLVLLIYFAYVFFITKQYRAIFIVQSVYLVSVLFDISWFYFGIEEFKLTVGRNTAIKIITTILIFTCVKTENDLWIYTIILTVGTAVGNMSLWMFFTKYAKIVRPKVKDILVHLKPMAILAVSVIAVSVYLYIDKIMIGCMSSMEQVGFYENSFKMIQFPIGLITAMGTVMLPRMSNLIDTEGFDKAIGCIDGSMKLIALVSPAIAFGLASVSEVFSIVFWGREFEQCGSILAILAITAILISWNNIIRTAYLIPLELDKQYVKAVCTGAVVDVVLNCVFIPLYGGFGAAIGTVGAYISVFLLQNWYARKQLEIAKYVKYFVPYVLFSAIMFGFVKLIGSILPVNVLGLLIQIVIGGAIYGIMAIGWIIFTRDSFFYRYLTKLNRMREEEKR